MSAKKTMVNPMLQAGDDSDDDDDNGKGPISNPLAEAMEDDGQVSAAQMIAANNESGMSEEELGDLTYAFQAADMRGTGVIDVNEFGLMLTVMGCDVTDAKIEELMSDAKTGFMAWAKLSDEENIAKCRDVWDQYDEDKSGTMDLKEITQVIAKLREMGSEPEPISAADMADGELDFDEFSAWFLKQEGLPDEFCAPGGKARTKVAGEKGIAAKIIGRTIKTALAPLQIVGKAASGPAALLASSAKMVKSGAKKGKGVGSTKSAMVDDTLLENEITEEEGDMLNEILNAKGKLLFAEFVFMMRGGLLKEVLSDDWQQRADDMTKLREAYDTADVDGNNELELAELEMVIISMNPKADVSSEDIGTIWRVLNPEGRDWIDFELYVRGMIKIKKDPALTNLIPMDVPNRFQLLSLLIDSPINEDQEAFIFKNMSGLEKIGIRALEKMREPQDPLSIKTTLKRACEGQLHYLTDEQRKNVRDAHLWCVLQACFIGSFCCFWPGLLENTLVEVYETDGVFDAYWMCNKVMGDPRAPMYANLSLPANPGAWGTRVVDQCRPGLCASVPDGIHHPDNISDYLAVGGNFAMGGNWTDGDGPCPLKGIPPQQHCDDACTALPQTHLRDQNAVMMFWIINVIGIVTGIVFELTGLMFTAVRSAVLVSKHIDLRLTPLNADRAFVANMLVRAAFEIGDSTEAVMGVESGKESSAEADERGALMNILAVAFIKGKVVITGTLFKQITVRVCDYDTATWLKPYSGTMLATAMWDTLMCHVIMKRSEARAFGVTTAVEVFNEIMDTYCPSYEANPTSLNEKARVQILRSIGVAIVKHGSMFPTMEILLRHAVNYLNMKKSKAVTGGGIIDNELAFVDDMDLLSLDESRAVLSVHMLCYVLDGSIGPSELLLWKKLLARVDDLYQVEREKFDGFTNEQLREFIVEECPKLTRAVSRVPKGEEESEELADIATFVPRPEKATSFDPLVPLVVCQKFRDNTPVSSYMLSATFDPDANMSYKSKVLTPDEISKFTINEAFFKITSILTKQI